MAKLIVITGGMGSGKSTICGFFKAAGAMTINADELVKDLLYGQRAEKELHKKIIDLLGHKVVKNNYLDRQEIIKTMVEDVKLRKLEAIIWPEIRKEIDIFLEKNKNERFIIAEIPMAIESDIIGDHLLVVDCEEETQMKRIKKRNQNLTNEQIRTRLNRQINRKTRLGVADEIISTENKGEEKIKEEINQIYLRYLKEL